MKKVILLVVLLALVPVAYFLFADTKPPQVSWGAEGGGYINDIFKIQVSDDRALAEVCYTITGGSCTGQEVCSPGPLATSVELSVDPSVCAPGSAPVVLQIAVRAKDQALIPNQVDAAIKLTFDRQPPAVTALQGTRYLKRGGAGVVVYEVGEVPEKTGVQLDQFEFKPYSLSGNTYLAFYVHPYDVAPDDFKARIFATDRAGNLTKIRPGSSTTERLYSSEDIVLTDSFLETVKDKLAANSLRSPLEAFIDINERMRGENAQKIREICSQSDAKRYWEGAFLRNLGAPRAGFADSRTYSYNGETVSRAVHVGIDIAGLINMNVVAANHGKVVYTGEIGIYGNVVVLDHGYGLHTLYGHLNRATVQVGDMVRKGDVIAISGETGLAFGDHLHFEVRVNGMAVDPREWFDKDWIASHIEPFVPKTESP